MNPKLSIIIPFYGNADKQLLDRCLHSIYEQKLEPKEYEIIIVDDEGKGLGGARNNGICKAQGDYLLFIDADDYYFPNTLFHYLITLELESPDILSFGFQPVYSSKIEIPKSKKKAIQTYASGSEYMDKNNYMGTAWRHFFRKELFIKNQLFFPENVFHEDEALVAKAYCNALKTLVSEEVVYAYYQRPHSILHKSSKAQRIKRLNDFRQILADLQVFQLNMKSATPQQQTAIQRRIHFLTIDYLTQLYRNRSPIFTISKVIHDLRNHNLLPLPSKGYSWKYTIIKTIINLFAQL